MPVQADHIHILDLALLYADEDAVKKVLEDPEIGSRVHLVRDLHEKRHSKIVALIEDLPVEDRTIHDTIALSRALYALSEIDAALECLDSMLSIGQEHEQQSELALRFRRARLYIHENRFSDAIADLTIASTISDALQYASVSSLIMQDLALIAMSLGDPVKAITYAEQALLYVDRSGVLTRNVVIQRINLAQYYVHVGRLEEALAEYTDLISNEIILETPKYALVAFLNLAITHKRLGNNATSLETYHRVLEIATAVGAAEYVVRALIGITDHYVIVGNVQQAKRYIDLAMEEVKDPEASFLDAIVNVHYANVDHSLGHHEEAISRLQAHYDAFNADQNVLDTILYGDDLANWLAEAGRYDEAFAVLKNCSSLQKSVYDQEIERTAQLSTLRSKLDIERESIRQRDEARTAVLNSVLPAHIAQRLLAGERKIGERVESVTILFADVVGFTQMSASMEPEQLVDLLEDLFTKMDHIALEYGCERIKTIGDSYMAACGLADATSDHVERICRTALAFLDQMRALPLLPHQLRIGIHTGPVVAGVMSGSKLSYDIWGDTVNVASRMENHSAPGRILCSTDVANALRLDPSMHLEKREPLDIRGKGLMTTYWLR